MKTIRRLMIGFCLGAIILSLTNFLIDYNLLPGICVLTNSVALYYWIQREA